MSATVTVVNCTEPGCEMFERSHEVAPGDEADVAHEGPHFGTDRYTIQLSLMTGDPGWKVFAKVSHSDPDLDPDEAEQFAADLQLMANQARELNAAREIA